MDEIIKKLQDQLAAKDRELIATKQELGQVRVAKQKLEQELRRYEYEQLLAERAAFATIRFSCKDCMRLSL